MSSVELDSCGPNSGLSCISSVHSQLSQTQLTPSHSRKTRNTGCCCAISHGTTSPKWTTCATVHNDKSCIDFRKPTSQGRRFSSKLGRVPFPDPLSLTPFPFLLLLPPFPSTPPKSNCRKLAGEWCKWPGLSIGCRRMSISMYFRLAGDDFHLVTNFSPWQLGQVHWRAGPNRCEKWSGPDPRSGWKLMPLLQVINSLNMIWSEAPSVYNNKHIVETTAQTGHCQQW